MPGPENSTGVSSLSYSSVSAYLICGRYWKYRYLDKVSATVAPALVFGSAFHNTVEAYIRNVAQSGQSAGLVEIWEDEWPAVLEKEGDRIAWADGSPDALLAEGTRILQALEVVQVVDAVTPLVDPDGRVHIEDFVKMEIPGVPVPIVGYIDIIDSDGVPGDFKTASRRWSEKNALNELQPLFYLAALEQVGHRSNPEMRFRHYVFAKTDPAEAQVIETRRTRGELQFLFDLIREVWKGIAARVFPPNPRTWKCSPEYCEYWGICRGKALDERNHFSH